MRDVFLSYTREDNDLAERLANALTASGVTVWWDHKIESGERFPQIIEQELAAAKFVVVLWSRASIGSEWVGNEARVGVERDVLVPALVEDVRPPLEFRSRQCANLVDWNNDPKHQGFRAILRRIQGAETYEHRLKRLTDELVLKHEKLKQSFNGAEDIFRSTPSFEQLTNQYISQGVSEADAKMLALQEQQAAYNKMLANLTALMQLKKI